MADYDLPMALRLPGTWTRDALCIEYPDLPWFPDRSDFTDRRTVAVCKRCAVRDECRDYAIEQRIQHGVFGGLTGKQRMRIWRSAAPA